MKKKKDLDLAPWHLQTMRLICFGQLHGKLPLEQMI